MADAPRDSLPEYLWDLLAPTPHGNAKLLAAWDGLTTESHMRVLSALKIATYPQHLAKRVMEKALESPNAYIRYLAANEIVQGGEDDEKAAILEKRIAADKHPLVKYCLAESVTHIPQAFFALPQQARLAQIRRLGIGDGNKSMASLITFALENLIEKGEVSEIELEEILTDYICRPLFKDRCQKDWLHYDGFLAYRTEEDLLSLWELVPKVPEKISYVLLQHLPPLPNYFQDIPESVLDHLTSHQLFTLLERPDIELREFRKQIFNRQNDSEDLVRSMAVVYHFHLTYEEFSDILKKPEKERIPLLLDLASYAMDLRLVFYQVLHDILEKNDTDYWECGEPAKREFERKVKNLEELKEWEKKSEMTQLKLYELAKNAVPWNETESGYLPKGKLEFLAGLTVPGDTWQTFRNYVEEWEKYNAEKLYKHLPCISAIEERAEYMNELEKKVLGTNLLVGRSFTTFMLLGQRLGFSQL